MTLQVLRARAMFQTGNDASDYMEFEPALTQYANEAYDALAFARDKARLSDEEGAPYPPLVNADDEPALPEWMHPSIADYASYMLYRTGNPSKQQRGMLFLQAFERVRGQAMKGENGYNNFINYR